MTSLKIKSVLFCEFDTTAGPRIAHQVPDNFLSKEEFDVFSVFVITKAELQNNLITINALGYKFIGCPIIIYNEKYARNEFIFNICLVFDACTDTDKYESVVKKLADYFKTLEVESEFLSKKENQERLCEILDQLLVQLNQGQCSIQIDKSTTINLKIISDQQTPSPIYDHDVPILYPGRPLQPTLQHLDLSTQQLMCYIDGFKHMARIAAEADVDIGIVKACVQNLVYHGVVKIIPTFQYGNVYVVTPNLSNLYDHPKLQEECLTFVARPGKKPNLRDVFTMYCGLASGTRVKDLCSRFNTNLLGIDERKLIQFGLLHGLIRRLNKYPIKSADVPHVTHIGDLYSEFDGLHSTDEICCKYGISSQDLEEQIDNDPSVVVCWK